MFPKTVERVQGMNDCPLWAGTAEEVATYRQRDLRRRRETEQPAIYAYAFTEMLILEFEGENEITKAGEEKPTDFLTSPKTHELRHASTEQGEAFMVFVRFIMKQPGLARLLWGKVFESEAKVMVLLDWQTPNAPQAMRNTPSFQQVSQRLEAQLKCPIHSEVFNFWDESMRDQSFGQNSTSPAWTAFYIWRFPAKVRDCELPIITARTSEIVSRTWEMHWNHFCHKMFLRQGDGCTSWMGSWPKEATTKGVSDDSSTQEDMYYGVIGIRSLKMLQDELALAEKLSYEEGGIEELRKIAADGLNVLHVRFLRPTQHSLGFHVPSMLQDIAGLYPR